MGTDKYLCDANGKLAKGGTSYPACFKYNSETQDYNLVSPPSGVQVMSEPLTEDLTQDFEYNSYSFVRINSSTFSVTPAPQSIPSVYSKAVGERYKYVSDINGKIAYIVLNGTNMVLQSYQQSNLYTPVEVPAGFVLMSAPMATQTGSPATFTYDEVTFNWDGSDAFTTSPVLTPLPE